MSEALSCPTCGADVSDQVRAAFAEQGWTLKGPLGQQDDPDQAISVTCPKGHQVPYAELNRT